MESLLISACLAGFECKYCGGSNKLNEDVLTALRAKYRLITACPETAGGLPTPREPSEIRGERVFSRLGDDVTAQYIKGGEVSLWLCKKYGCKKALMKEQSPSCGSGMIYDGSFSGKLVPGHGVAAAMLRDEGIEVLGESRVIEIV